MKVQVTIYNSQLTEVLQSNTSFGAQFYERYVLDKFFFENDPLYEPQNDAKEKVYLFSQPSEKWSTTQNMVIKI